MAMEKGEKCRSTQRTYKENTSPKPMAKRTRWAEFLEFLQAAGLKA